MAVGLGTGWCDRLHAFGVFMVHDAESVTLSSMA